MSSLAGHMSMTRRAVELLEAEGHPVCRALTTAKIARRAAARDIFDLLTLGHWSDFAQCHHFMRRFDGQSEREAYAEAVAWVRARATRAAVILARQLRTERAAAILAPHAGSTRARLDLSSQALGDALHAVQDSFARGHAEREAPRGDSPGAIRRIKRYAGADKAGHAEADLEWRGPGHDGISAGGWQAVHASRELLRLIADAGAAGAGAAATLDGFESYRQTWLAASAALSAERDRPIGFFSRFLPPRDSATTARRAILRALLRATGARPCASSSTGTRARTSIYARSAPRIRTSSLPARSCWPANR
jgi:hypothetical protein